MVKDEVVNARSPWLEFKVGGSAIVMTCTEELAPPATVTDAKRAPTSVIPGLLTLHWIVVGLMREIPAVQEKGEELTTRDTLTSDRVDPKSLPVIGITVLPLDRAVVMAVTVGTATMVKILIGPGLVPPSFFTVTFKTVPTDGSDPGVIEQYILVGVTDAGVQKVVAGTKVSWMSSLTVPKFWPGMVINEAPVLRLGKGRMAETTGGSTQVATWTWVELGESLA
jgi:hypothetical protein